MRDDRIERYIYAVTKRLPSKMRKDVEQELRGLIDDMLEARCGEILPTDQDIRVVLTEMGLPSELARKYDPNGERSLIGPAYFSRYRMVLGIVLLAVLFGMAVTSIVLAIVEPTAWYMAIASWLFRTISGLVSAFAIVTLLFAIFERHKVDLGEEELANLPPVPQKKERIGRGEPIFGIVFCVLFAVIFLAAPQIIGYISIEGGTTQFIPVFSVEVIRSGWLFILLFALLGIGREVMNLYEGRYTRRLALAATGLNIASLLLAVLFFTKNQLMNPQFIEKIGSIFSGQEAFITNIFAHFNLFVLGIIAFALILDTGVTLFRGFRYDRK